MNFKNQYTYNSLLALSIGDAAGENQLKILPQSQYKAGNVSEERGTDFYWPWTDDTAMAIGVVRTLFTYNAINQQELAEEFSKNYFTDKQRGYGKGTANLLTQYSYDLENWESHSRNWWGPNTGSKGNGSAMRDSVIGAHFASFGNTTLSLVAQQARLSAEVTHFHKDAIDGSIAVALAAATVTASKTKNFWIHIINNISSGEMREKIKMLSSPEMNLKTNWEIVDLVGNGSKVTALDTVPFAIWLVHKALNENLTLQNCIDLILEVGGDTDTVAAMVCGILGNVIFPTKDQIERTEPLPTDLTLE